MGLELSGNSGCRISIIKEHDRPIVRKTSPNDNYNDRFVKQFDKQKSFKHKSMITTPVVSLGYDDKGLFYFDMKYINGISLSKRMFTMPLTHLPDVAKKLSDGFSNDLNYDMGAKMAFMKKIKSVMKTIDDNGIVKERSQKTLLADAEMSLLRFEWDHVIRSDCHGDLTLENIIMSGNDLYIVDLLDSFYDSWMIDAAKLLQDIELGWSYRYESVNENLSIRLIILRNTILEKIQSLPDGERLLETVWHILLLNILRIIPYAKDETTMNFLT